MNSTDRLTTAALALAAAYEHAERFDDAGEPATTASKLRAATLTEALAEYRAAVAGIMNRV